MSDDGLMIPIAVCFLETPEKQQILGFRVIFSVFVVKRRELECLSGHDQADAQTAKQGQGRYFGRLIELVR